MNRIRVTIFVHHCFTYFMDPVIHYIESAIKENRIICTKFLFCLIGLLLIIAEVKADEVLVPSLLIDASLTNTNPGVGEQFCYKIRYRCNSTTEHCTDAYIEMTIPDGMKIGSLPPISGNIVNITQSVGTPSGTYVKVELETPSSAGLLDGILAAGSSGIFEICLIWECLPEGNTQDPIPGSLINFVSEPTFYASGSSTTANSVPDVFVPSFDSCGPTYTTNGAYRKTSPSASNNVNPGGSIPFVAQIPAHTGPLTFTEMFDTSMLLLSNVELPDTSWKLEILCDTSWFAIPNIYQDLSQWLVANANAGTLSNLEIAGIQTGCSADTNAITASEYGHGYVTDITGLRVTSDTTNNFTYTNFRFVVKDSVPIGSEIGNCFVFEDTAIGTICVSPLEIVAEPSLSHFKTPRSGIGDLNVPTYPAGLPSKQADDILWEVRWGAPDVNGDPVTGFIIRDTLPQGLTFDTDPVNGNWTYSFLPGNFTIPAPYDMYDQPACHNPTFSSNILPDGRTLLEWNYGTCTSYPGFGFNSRPQIFFTTRYDKTVPLPSTFDNCVYFGLSDGTQVWCGVGNGSSTEPMCADCATSPVPATGGAIYGSKAANGNLDTSFSIFPNNGDTDTSGAAIYEIQIEVADLEGIEKLDIVDILPHIGDTTLSPRVARNSEWSAEIAGAITVEKYDIVLQSWVPVTTEITNTLYSTTYNPCYMDASLQIRTQTGLPEPAVANCGSTDFSAANPAIGAKAFALTWQDTIDPLLFGEILKIQIPIQQLAGEADPVNGAIAWNSFGVTGTQPDDDELFSSEPLKVGLQMLSDDFVALGDKIWNDANANGIQDPNELPISGVTVSLLDNAGNPVMLGGLPLQQITDQNGNYQFSGLDPNTTYQIRLDDLSDFNNSGSLANLNLTQPNLGTDDNFDSDAALIGNFPAIYALTGPTGVYSDSYDFGFYQGAIICGYAWDDNDADGIQDAVELAMDSIQVELINSGGAIVDTAYTNSVGAYNFPNIIPGTYTLQITHLGTGGYTFTAPNVGGDDNLDSDVDATGLIGPIVVEGGDQSCNHDVGLMLPLPNPAAIVGTVWDELINDGIQDANEIGVAGVQVNLLDAAQFVLATTTTDVNGNYEFNNLPPNEDYYINVVPGISNPITSPQDAGGDDTVDSDVDPISGTTAILTPLPDETIEHVDAGIIFPYSLGNQVWLDDNQNGLLDANEGIVPGAEIYLYDVTNGIYLDTTMTDVNGKFVFTGLQPGDYLLELLLPNNLISTNDVGTSSLPNDVDNDDNGIGILNATHVKSSVVSIVAGGGNVGDANWLETDHGLAINGAFDLTSNPKAYYTLDFGLQYKLDCAVPLVQYAITDGAITKPGQTTDYFYQDTLQNFKTYVNHIPMVQQDGVIRCFDYCEFGQWIYYFNPMDPEEYLFAIEHGANVTPIEYIELRVDDVPSDRYAVSSGDATYVMSRDWFVRTVNDAPLLDATGNPTTVNIRFYFPEEEFKEIIDEAVAQANVWGGYVPTVSDVYWFKKDTFDPDIDIDSMGSLLTPFDITSLRSTPTTALGVNTKDGITGETGNGKNHIQFNGITGFSGGTAAITINKVALPATISSFEVEVMDCNATLNWQSQSETNFSHYIIEKSVDGQNFEFVHQVQALQSTETKNYNYTDKNIDENYFYRLKLLNLDGTYSYSNMISSESECAGDVSSVNVFPNPITVNQASINVSFQSKSEVVKWISIVDSFGNEKLTFAVDAIIGKNALSVDISNLYPGLHVLTIKGTKGKIRSKRFVVARK